MLLHQLGEYFILSLELLFQFLDAFLFLVVIIFVSAESQYRIFEKKLLPFVKNRWLKIILLTESGYRDSFQ